MSAPPLRPLDAPRDSEARIVVGLMSGTSLDGISAAVVRFDRDQPASADVLAFVQCPYAAEQRTRIERATTGATPAEYARLDVDLGGWLAAAAIAAIAEADVPLASIAAIASHGQTIWHEPGAATWQLGQAAVIAERTGIDVVSDFRVRDVAAGGEGAPLVPIADAMLWSSATAWRALQNLGGIANVTVVPAGGALDGVRAFDTGPGVGIIDAVARRVRPSLPFDVDGALARAGTAMDLVVGDLLADPWFAMSPPRSTGRERFGAAYADRLVAACRAATPAARDEDLVATAVALTAASIADAFARFVPEPADDVLVSGGGARNPALFDAVVRALAPRTVRHFAAVYFDGDAKEAVAFALLGWLHLTNRPGNVPRATGARGPRRLGVHTPA